ncbi:MAG: gamma-glutamylcyclotransferase [Planctomycetaceae bacterium]|nr:gamma-glutamylcyclotransferase [Planctomycetaceae bacterium]
MSRSLIFVYGTLMQGECRHHALHDQELVGIARTQPSYRLVDCGTYPGLLEVVVTESDGSEARGESVLGEVWAVTSECLVQLDEVEGVDEGLYARRAIAMQHEFADVCVEAYFYLPDASQLATLPPDWRQRAR